MDSPENVFDKLHRLGCDRDRRVVILKEIEQSISVLEQQLHAKRIALQDNHNIKVNLEVKIATLAKEIK
jgi:NADH:ubiquinone oxidoreductase subunit D